MCGTNIVGLDKNFNSGECLDLNLNDCMNKISKICLYSNQISLLFLSKYNY